MTFGVGFFSFFNFRLGTYNVPEGPSANLYVEARRAEFDGTGWTDGDQKCPLHFFELSGNLEHVYIYLYTKKNAANILMGFKI